MKTASAFALIALAVSATPAISEERADIIDFMVMDVCLDGDGQVMPGISPLDASCTLRRDIRPGDRAPYHLTRYLDNPPPCDRRRTIRDNVLMEHEGTERVLGAVMIQRGTCKPDPAPIPAYYSVRWADEKFGFIMGAWSRGRDGGKVGGGITRECERDPASSSRHFRNWLLAPANGLKDGEVGYQAINKWSSFDGLPDLGAPCPTQYRARYLAIWTRGDFQYASGAVLNTILSHPYSQADETGTTPRNGRQMERTYWTRELGQTRWENWKREDFRNRKIDKSALDLSEESASVHSCTPPFPIVGKATPGIKLGPLEERDGIFSQVLTNLRTGEKHRWYMSNCQDVTEIVPPADPNGDPYPDTTTVIPEFWDFWR